MEYSIAEAKLYFWNLHDIECNQKYNKTLPYSFHLEMVEKQVDKYKHLIPNLYEKSRPLNTHSLNNIGREVFIGAFSHDSLEDARLTYNDINEKFGDIVAEIAYLCTENKGRNRAARKSEDFYKELATNKLAVFVKLCDIMANVKFSLLSNSSMFTKYKEEYPKVKKYLSIYPEYSLIFEDFDKIFNL